MVNSSFTKCQEDTTGKGQAFQQTVLMLGKLDMHTQKNETVPLFYNICKKKTKTKSTQNGLKP